MLVKIAYIKPIQNKDCKKCKFYLNSITKKPKCSKFNYFSDDKLLIHEFALDCREDENKCGVEGKYFIDSNINKIEKIF